MIAPCFTTDLAFLLAAPKPPACRCQTGYRTVNVYISYGIHYDKSYTKEKNVSITATQLKSNLGYYLALAATETIFISKNGKNIAVLSSPQSKRTDLIDSLRGILPDEGKTVKDYREERLSGKYL